MLESLPVRCLASNPERHRCASDALPNGYCAPHQSLARFVEPTQPSPTPLARLFKRADSARRLVPDPSNFHIPRGLKNSPTPVVIQHLLRDPSVTTRWLAAYTLRRRRDPGTVESLWQVLHEEPVSYVRQQSAVALGKIGTVAALGPLIEALWHDSDSAVRQACAIALGNLGYEIASQDLLDALVREPSVFVRWDCALALGQIGDGAAEKILTRLINTDKSEIVRSACREAMGEIQRRLLA